MTDRRKPLDDLLRADHDGLLEAARRFRELDSVERVLRDLELG